MAIALVGGGALVAAFMLPTIATTQRTGVVTGFVATNSETGAGFNATIYVESRQVLVPLSAAHSCFAGATIKLRKTRMLLLGDHYAAADNGCDRPPVPNDGR